MQFLFHTAGSFCFYGFVFFSVEAGITPHSEPGNAVAVGNGAISIHRLAQAVQLTFPVKLTDEKK